MTIDLFYIAVKYNLLVPFSVMYICKCINIYRIGTLFVEQFSNSQLHRKSKKKKKIHMVIIHF